MVVQNRCSATAILTGKMKIEGDLNFMAEFRELFTPLKIKE